MCKIYNSLKMMGVDGRKAIEFADAYNSLPLTTNPKIKSIYINTLLTTPILGKTLVEHHAELYGKCREMGILPKDENISIDQFHINLSDSIQLRDYKFNVDNVFIDQRNIDAMLKYVLQKYYEKNL